MIINYLGHACFKLKGKRAIVVTDPYDRSVFGKEMPKTAADIVTISHAHPDHASVDRIKNSPFIIRGPGEYEIKGVSIFGFGTEQGKNTIYLYQMEDLKLCHLGDLASQLTEKQTEKIGELDILMIPVGGVSTIDAKEAALVVNQLEPKVVIPMDELKPVNDFLAEMGEKGIKPIKQLKITKASLPEEREVVWLKK